MTEIYYQVRGTKQVRKKDIYKKKEISGSQEPRLWRNQKKICS